MKKTKELILRAVEKTAQKKLIMDSERWPTCLGILHQPARKRLPRECGVRTAPQIVLTLSLSKRAVFNRGELEGMIQDGGTE